MELLSINRNEHEYVTFIEGAVKLTANEVLFMVGFSGTANGTVLQDRIKDLILRELNRTHSIPANHDVMAGTAHVEHMTNLQNWNFSFVAVSRFQEPVSR